MVIIDNDTRVERNCIQSDGNDYRDDCDHGDGWWIIEWMIMMLRMKSKTGCRGGLRDGLYENGNNYD